MKKKAKEVSSLAGFQISINPRSLVQSCSDTEMDRWAEGLSSKDSSRPHKEQ